MVESARILSTRPLTSLDLGTAASRSSLAYFEEPICSITGASVWKASILTFTGQLLKVSPLALGTIGPMNVFRWYPLIIHTAIDWLACRKRSVWTSEIAKFRIITPNWIKG